MAKSQSNRLTVQQKKAKGVVGIFGKGAKKHNNTVYDNAKSVLAKLKRSFPKLSFRHRRFLTKKEINNALQKIDSYLGQTLFLDDSKIIPDGGLIEVKDDDGNWRVILVSEAKFQGKDIDNIKRGVKVGAKGDQDLMAAGNAIERAHKNISEIANYMLSETYFPYVLFLAGSNFLTCDITVTRPDGSRVKLRYNDGTLNRLDRLTAANYGMPINTNLCENRYVLSNSTTMMLQAASIYTQGKGGSWSDKKMIDIMYEVALLALKKLSPDLFLQQNGSV